MDFSYPSAGASDNTVSSFGQAGFTQAGNVNGSANAAVTTPVSSNSESANSAQIAAPSQVPVPLSNPVSTSIPVSATVNQNVSQPLGQTNVTQNNVSQPAVVTNPMSASTIDAAPVNAQLQVDPLAEIKKQTVVETDTVAKDEKNPEKSTSENTEKSSPLKDLAKKISQLKSEFITVEKTDLETPEVKPASEMPQVDVTPANAVQILGTTPIATESTLPEKLEVSDQSVNQFSNMGMVDKGMVEKVDPKPAEAANVEASAVMPVVDNAVVDATTMNSVQPNLTEQTAQVVEDIPLKTKLVEVDTTAPLPTYSKPKGKKYVYTIEQLLDMVIERDASDLHLTVNYPAMLRVDGTLVPVSQEIVTEENVSDLILPVLKEEKRDRLEVNREVDLAYSHDGKGRFRINAFYQKQTLAAAFRLIPTKIRSIDELNLPPIYHQLTKLGQGLVLVTGPTGHGKSTTLAGIIQEINLTRACHILTIEDPIEYIFPQAKAMVAQREVQDDTHSWEIALKSALREDPNVILVGEMRDYETIASAITLAETGHLVFATLHTNNAAQTIDRIIDVFPENQQPQVRSQLSNIIEAVIAQRLVPINGGGRRAVSEIMLANAAVRNLIREGKTHQIDNVIRTSADVGMISLEHSLIKLVRDGMITMERAQEYSVRPEEIVRLLKG